MEKPYEKGSIVLGYVTGIKDYGIFVQLGEKNSGLIHKSQISRKFVKDIHQYVTLKELIRVKIIGKEKDKYQLSIKDLDYRIMEKKESKIEETESGFKNLAIFLDQCIKNETKKLEIAKNKREN